MAKRHLLLVMMGVLALPLAAAQRVPVQQNPDACQGPRVDAPVGALCGVQKTVAGRSVNAYLGIPYAESTAGSHRFRPPVPEPHWSGVRDASAFGPVCPQTGTAVKGLPSSEDCLSINVWTPAAAKPKPASFVDELARLKAQTGAGGSAPSTGRPVLVFLYGGGFVHGASSQQLYPGGPSLYDGARMAATQGIVVVTLNYRVGVLGFLAGAPGVTPNL
ncbi:MAG: carboxylesterase family protein, partial [Deinococcales bacterium]